MKNIKSYKHATYIDTFSINIQHENFNASLIYMISNIYMSINCICHKSNYINISKLSNLSNNVNHIRTYVLSGKSKIKLFFRYIISAFSNIIYLIFSKKESIIFFPFNNLFSLRLINTINFFLNRNIIIFCHGELEGVLEDYRPNGFLAKLLKKLSCNFFNNRSVKIHNSIYFVVLGDKLLSNLSKILDNDKLNHFLSIDHPYFFEKTVKSLNQINQINQNIINLGTIGTMTYSKGYMSLLSFLEKSLLSNSYNFVIVGKIYSDINLINKFDFVDLNYNKELTRDEFNEIIEKLNYVLYFYPRNSYTLTASGAIMDSILHEKPIFAIKNDYFQYLFDKFGSFGILYENIDLMIQNFPKDLSNNTFNNFNYKELKRRLSPDFISYQLFDELSRIHFI